MAVQQFSLSLLFGQMLEFHCDDISATYAVCLVSSGPILALKQCLKMRTGDGVRGDVVICLALFCPLSVFQTLSSSVPYLEALPLLLKNIF